MNEERVSISCVCGDHWKIVVPIRTVVLKWPRCTCGRMMKAEKYAVAPVANGIRMVRPRQSARPIR